MKLAASVLVVVLAGCAADGADSVGGAGTNPPTLWLAMGSGSVMKLVDVEPHPY
ncbi:MAG TPA: hypothetical protein VFV99_13725 [Kofleriaceae bacterium]|nr:hypothetical protein [Kofleriaceae bacterium]